MISIKNDVEIDVTPRDLLKKINVKDQMLDLDVNIPDSFFQTLLEQFFEREYLNDTSEKQFQYVRSKALTSIQWVQIERLPIHPNQNESYDLLTRWQGVLSSLHVWNYRLIFLLMRKDGQTKIYLGTTSDNPLTTPQVALEQIKEATSASMPGIGLKTLDKLEVYNEISEPLGNFREAGAVTGIPSFQKVEDNTLIQTLDPLAFGVRDSVGNEKDYALVVVSEPIKDSDIADIIARFRSLGSKIHTAVKMTGTQSSTKGETKEQNAKAAAGFQLIGTLVGAFLNASMLGSGLGKSFGALFGLGAQVQASGSASVNTEFLDKFAEYAEKMTDKHVQRLTEGRNLGFWNSGVYVLANLPKDVTTVTGMLRSIYSGDETYLEPIRLHLFKNDSKAKEIISEQFRLLPLKDIDLSKEAGELSFNDGQWHLLGKEYQYISTPINTKELSLVTSLPRRDVPGLRFVKTAVRFANNPAVLNGDRIQIGNLVDTGVIQSTTYDIDPNSLVRHALIAGSTGSGKSTTCKRILSEVLTNDTPIMIIEPAKDDYVRWALKMNETLPDEKKFKIFMPGVSEFEGVKTEELCINGYAPAHAKGAKIDLLQHSETFATLLNACLPSEDVIPILIEEVVYEQLKMTCNEENIDFESSENDPLVKYPDIDNMIATANIVMKNKNYEEKVKSNMKEVLFTRFKSLKRGMRGRILNTKQSVDYDKLFNQNVVINISRLSGSKDKALVMSLIMNALYEYRISRYNNDETYRKEAQKNKLLHLCLVEEAHNVLLKPQGQVSSGSPQNAVADLFGNMLSEVRGYGQGFMIVDQVPTRLIDDVIKNTNYKIVHRLTAPDDQEIMARCMAFREDQTYIIPALEKGNAIICGDEDDAAVWVKIPAPGKQVQ